MDRVRRALSSLAFPFWNGAEARPRGLLRLLAFALGFALVVGLSVLVSMSARGLREPLLTLTLAFSTQAIGLVIWTYVVARFVDRRAFGALGIWRRRGASGDALYGILLGFAAIAGISIAERALGYAHYETYALEVLVGRVPAVLAALVIFTAVAITEEVGFRAYLMTNLAETLRWTRLSARNVTLLSVVLSSLVFGLAHAANPNASLIAVANITVGGVFLAAGYVLMGDLALPLGLHLGWNLGQALLDMPVSGQAWLRGAALVSRSVHEGHALEAGAEFGPEAGLTGLLAMGGGTLVVVLWSRARVGRLAIDPSFGEPPRRSADHELAGSSTRSG